MAVKGVRDRWLWKHYNGGTYSASHAYSVIIHGDLLCRDHFFVETVEGVLFCLGIDVE